MKAKFFCAFLVFFFIYTIVFCQNIFFEDERIADSIYYNHDGHTTVKEFEKAKNLYTNLVKLTSKNDLRYNQILSKKLALEAAYFEHNMQLDTALVYSKKSLEVQNKLQRQNLFLKGLTYKRLYKQWGALNNMDSMLVYAKKARETFRDTLGEQHKLIADAIFDIGGVYARKGLRDKNIEYYKKAIAMNIATNGEFTPEAAIQEHHLALTYGFIGFYRKELESYKKVIKRWEAISDYKDMSYLSVAYTSLATWYLEHGDIDTAEKYVLKNETLINTRKNDLRYWFNETFKGRTQLRNWYTKATLALHKKDTASTIFYNDKILDFIANFDEKDNTNNPHNLPFFKNFVDLQHMASLRLKAKLLEIDAPEKAKELYEKAINLIHKDGVASSGLSDKLFMIDFYINSNAFEKAQQKITLWQAIAEKKKSAPVLMQLHAKMGAIFTRKSDFKKADSIYKSVFKMMVKDSLQDVTLKEIAYNDCKPYGDHRIIDLILNASDNYYKAYLQTDKIEYQENAYNLSVLAASIFSNNFSHLPYNEEVYKTTLKINELLLSNTLALDSKNIKEVLERIELNNSKLTWRKFLNSKQQDYLDVPDSIIEHEKNLKSEQYFYKKLLFLDNESDLVKVKHYKKKLLDIKNEIEGIEQWYSSRYPKYYNQTIESFTLDEIQQKLKANQQIIKYLFTNKFVYAFVVEKSNVTLTKIASIREVTLKAKAFLNALKVPTSTYKELAKALYNLLLPDAILNNEKNNEFIFIPDDVLHYLPMETLISKEDKFLIQNHTVSYVPSLLLFKEQLDVKKARRNKLGIFAPTYHSFFQENPKRNDSTALLGAYSESMKIAKMFNADVYSGDAANRMEFLTRAKEYSMLHLAMHSTINNKNAEFSNLTFSPDSKDNKLYISELYNMSLNADLAVLSACNTGSGLIEKGEGLVNTSRAFTYAGVPSIVSSLWAVPDKETSQIMISFYEYLKLGKAKNSALRQAKLDYLNITDDAILKHPYYWAGFVVSGDISPIESSSNNLWMYSLAFVLCLGVLFFFRKKLINFF